MSATETIEIFTPEASWQMDDGERVAALVRSVRLWRLAGFDGCACGQFSVRGYDVRISCHKSSGDGPSVVIDADHGNKQAAMDAVIEDLGKAFNPEYAATFAKRFERVYWL